LGNFNLCEARLHACLAQPFEKLLVFRGMRLSWHEYSIELFAEYPKIGYTLLAEYPKTG
jgi:hypothetical protein